MNNTIRPAIYGRIKVGTKYWQDHRCCTWPYTLREHFGGAKVDPDTRFKFEIVNPGMLDATAPGFGDPGNYGDGALTLFKSK